MTDFIDNLTTTENGAIAYSTTNSKGFDLFTKLIRGASYEKITELFYDSWLENPIQTLQILLNCRDCRSGKGERQIVLHCLSWLRKHKPKTYVKNLPLFLKVGYYQDLLNLAIEAEKQQQPLLGNNDLIELEMFAEQLKNDHSSFVLKEPITLAAKWAPTEDHADDREYEFASRIAKILFPNEKHSYTMKAYRNHLTDLRAYLKIVESQMAHDEWSLIEYGKVPAKSHRLHTSAFKKHDLDRYNLYLENINNNKESIKSTGTQPHEITRPFMHAGHSENEETLQAQWNDMIMNLRKNGKLNSVLPLCDVSSSMNGEPMEVCIALGLMVSELVEGPFKNRILTFESNPKLIHIKSLKLSDRVRELKRAPWGGSTNLMAAFEQILNFALMMKCSQDQLPKVLLIFSDMQFDSAVDDSKQATIFQLAKDKFESEGYQLPNVVFWNLSDTHKSFPITIDERGVAMLSGYSAQLLKVIMNDPENISPLSLMKLITDKYEGIVIDEGEIGVISDAVIPPVIYNHPDKHRRRKQRGKGPGSIRRKKDIKKLDDNYV